MEERGRGEIREGPDGLNGENEIVRTKTGENLRNDVRLWGDSLSYRLTSTRIKRECSD